MDLQRLAKALEGQKSKELGKELFLTLSSLVPMVNIDLLLISDDSNEIVLTWRADEFYGPGWHVPGSVIRHKETWGECLAKLASRELGLTLCFDESEKPTLVQQVFNNDRCVRGHFISLLFLKRVSEEILNSSFFKSKAAKFKAPPENLIPQHKFLYLDYLDELLRN